ncbi:hypothetical protein XELAEV_18044448mg [Xenopus laevis]|uniref:Uncharacterized protein n=1 Tax=Xenopus laevis TaxID=8355 RepID=A0A974H3T4_XENLA|nr:hypothetical protein XELAEV_18044448mg [Xenopus laevis]
MSLSNFNKGEIAIFYYMRSSNFNKGENITFLLTGALVRVNRIFISKKEAHGVDFCGVDDDYYQYYYYIVRPDLNCYMRYINIFNLHPSCSNGDHYVAHKDDFFFYIIKGNSYRRVTNMNKDKDVYTLHPNCQGGDHYLTSGAYFYLPELRYGWGLLYYRSGNFNNDEDSNTFSFLSLAFSQVAWPLPKVHHLAHGITWTKKITKKVVYEKEKMSSIDHNWKISLEVSMETGGLSPLIAKSQFSLKTEYGGCSINTERENWTQATEVEESLSITLQPKFKNDSTPPTDNPLPPV